jgi:hypothetical protein
MARVRKTIIGKPPDNELYTPEYVMSWLPAVDLDPAWCEHAVTWPRYYYTKEMNGLAPENPWNGDDIQVIFCNPPYQDLLDWIYRMVQASRHETRPQVWAFLQAKPGETAWMEYIWPFAAAVGFLPGRIVHGRPPGAEKSTGGTFNSALVLWDMDEERAQWSIEQVQSNAKGHRRAPVFIQPLLTESKALRTPEEIRQGRKNQPRPGRKQKTPS